MVVSVMPQHTSAQYFVADSVEVYADDTQALVSLYVYGCDTVRIGDRLFTRSTEYVAPAVAIGGRQVTKTYYITVMPTRSSMEEVSGCDSYTWHYGSGLSETFTASRSVSRRVPRVVCMPLYGATSGTPVCGCDSIKRLRLTLAYTDSLTEHIHHCDQYQWWRNAAVFTQSGTDTVWMRKDDGCDSVVVLQLTLGHSNAATADSSVCDSLVWHNTVYRSSQTIVGHDLNATRCDSATTLRLTVLRSSRVVDHQFGCDSLLWSYDGTVFRNSASQHIVVEGGNAAGCDSVIDLRVVVARSSASDTSIFLVQNELPYTFNGAVFDADTRHADTVVTIVNNAGCDSNIHVALTVYENISTVADTSLCDNVLRNGFRWNGVTFYSSATRIGRLMSATGSDSLITMNVVALPTYKTVIDSVVCEGAIVNFYDRSSSISTTLTHRMTSIDGCDSVEVLHLTVNPVYHKEESETICNNHLRLFCRSVCDTSGTYRCQMLTRAGCDSIEVLHLNIRDTSVAMLYDTIVQNQLPYTYMDQHFDAAAIYGTAGRGVKARSVGGNAEGCDSVVTYHLHVWRNVQGTDDTTVCENDYPVVWHGQRFDSAGIGTASVPNYHGADSVLTLTMRMRPCPTRTIRETVIENDLPVVRYGIAFADTVSNYLITLHNAMGCDSLIYYNLHVHRNSRTVIDTGICEDAFPIVWHGYGYERQGMYGDTLVGPYGTDSVVFYLVRSHPRYDDTIVRVICNNVPLLFDDTILDTDGTYTYNGFSRYGCDSTSTVELTVNSISYGEQYDTIVENRLYDVHDTPWGTRERCWLYHVRAYTDSVSHDTVVIANSAGCDSIIDYNLFVYRNYDSTSSITICSDALPLTIDSVTFAAADFEGNPPRGTFTRQHKLYNIHGADSVINYRLTVNPSWHIDEHQLKCENDTRADLQWHDTVLLYGSPSGSYYLPRRTLLGCDSIVSLQLTVHRDNDTTIYDTIVENQTLVAGGYRFNGLRFADTTTITDTLVSLINMAQCDSSIHYNLYVHRNIVVADSMTMCYADSLVRWNGITFSLSHLPQRATRERSAYGSLCDTALLLRSSGADSMVVMTLVVHPVYSIADYDTICDDTVAYHFDNVYRYAVHDTLLATTVSGCDSLRSFHLVVHPTYDTLVYDTIYENITYAFGGQLIGGVGRHVCVSDTVSRHGCDSLVTLHLVVNHYTPIDSLVCNNKLPMMWNGILFQRPSQYVLHLPASDGLDSIVYMVLRTADTTASYERQQACDRFLVPDGRIFNASCDTITYRLPNSVGCDSVVHLSLVVNYSNEVNDTLFVCDSLLWDDGIVYRSSTSDARQLLHNRVGCDSLVTLDLTVAYSSQCAIADSQCSGMAYYFDGDTFYVDGTYSVHTVNSVGCDSLTMLTLSFVALPSLELVVNTDCGNLAHSITAVSDASYCVWQARMGDSLWTFDSHLPTITLSPERETFIDVTASYNSEGLCPVSGSVAVDTIWHPHAAMRLVPDFISLENNTISATALGDIGLSTEWYINDQLWSADQRQLTATVDSEDDSVKVSLVVTSLYCNDTATVTLPVVHPTLFVPSLFTPGEASNNVLRVQGHQVADYEISIYNRQGLLVFHSDDVNISWDGTYRGSACPQGSYAYIIRYRVATSSDLFHTQRGMVTLLR